MELLEDRAILDEIDALIDRLADQPERAEVASRIPRVARLATRLDAIVAGDLAKLDRTFEYRCYGFRTALAWTRRALQLSRVDAARVLRRARQSAAMPIAAPLWLDGRLNSAHVDMLAAARKRTGADESFADNEARFCRRAITDRPERLQSDLQQWQDQIDALRHDPNTGDGENWTTPELTIAEVLDRVGIINGKLDAEGAATVQRALANEYERAHRANDPRSPAHQRADALVEICRRSLEHTGRGHQRPHLLVHTDLETVLGLGVGLSETDRGIRLPPHVVQRLACDAWLQHVVRDAKGVVVHLGRAQRRFSSDQRRALIAMYPTCAMPDCTIPSSDCQMHHNQDWLHGGTTDLGNGMPLCYFDHDAVHRGERRATMHPDGRIEWHDREGHHVGTTRPRPPTPKLPIVDLEPEAERGPDPEPHAESDLLGDGTPDLVWPDDDIALWIRRGRGIRAPGARPRTWTPTSHRCPMPTRANDQ